MKKVLAGVTVTALTACLGLVFLFPLLSWEPPRPTKKTLCLSNIKQMTTGLLIYAEDNGERLPSANWMDIAEQEQKASRPFRCSELPKPSPDAYGYAMHKRMVGRQLKKLKEPEKVIMLFESTDLGRNVVGDLTLMPVPGRHNGSNISFADGHVKAKRNIPDGE